MKQMTNKQQSFQKSNIGITTPCVLRGLWGLVLTRYEAESNLI